MEGLERAIGPIARGYLSVSGREDQIFSGVDSPQEKVQRKD